ncbi:hypothetical protein JW848_09480 [Candidatus Bipolaricaulota bacterium]|nr:hypothetical protein [Candidatus Bipolaricaulota bacterium]
MASRREFLVCIHPSRPAMLSDGGTAEENDLIDRHFLYLSNLAEKGIVLLAGRTEQTVPSAFGVILLRTASEQRATEIVHGDPAIAAGVFRAQLFPFKTALFAHPPIGDEPAGK